MLRLFALIVLAGSHVQTSQGPGFNTFPFGDAWIIGKSGRELLFATDFIPIESSREEVSRCTRACKGNIHLLHAQCDRSCDDKCAATHEMTIKPTFVPSDVTDKDFVEFGSAPYLAELDGVMKEPVGAQRMKGLDQMLREHIEEQMANSTDLKAFEYEWKSGHWNDAPCSSSAGTIEMKNFRVVVNWYVSDAKPTPVPGKNYSTGFHSKLRHFEAGTLRVPVRKVSFGDPVVACRCEIIKTGKPVKEVGGIKLRTPTGEYLASTKQEQEYAMGFVCENMNNLTFTATINGGDATGVSLLPGTIFVSLDPAYQDEMLIDEPRLEFIEAHAGPSARSSLLGSAKGRLVCLSMTKKEPEPNVEYRAMLCNDAVLYNLASHPASGPYRTIIQQVRTWIYRDRADHGAIKERLLPAPNAAMYVNCLFDVEDIGRAMLGKSDYGRCFDPNLLASGASPRAMAWFAQRSVEWKPREVAAWLGSRPESLAELFSSSSADGAAALVRGLLTIPKPDVVRALLTYLSGTIPAASRPKLVAAGVIQPVGKLLLRVQDAALAALALDVLDSYSDSQSLIYLSTFAEKEKLGTPAMRSRAGAIAARLDN